MMSTAQCPVCGMEVDPTSDRIVATHDAQTYQFCSQSCRDAFQKDPGRYVGNTGS